MNPHNFIIHLMQQFDFDTSDLSAMTDAQLNQEMDICYSAIGTGGSIYPAGVQHQNLGVCGIGQIQFVRWCSWRLVKIH